MNISNGALRPAGTMAAGKLTWKDVVREALSSLGGQAHLSQINDRIEGHPKTATNPTWRDTVRRVVRQYKVFEPVPPDRSGTYRLVEEPIPGAGTQEFVDEPDVNHGIAQGMLVVLGNIYGYETYVPPHDQTVGRFQGTPLRGFVTVGDCSGVFPHSRNLTKIREIDVLWFDEDDDGLFPTHGFEVELTTGVKSGLDRLLKIPQRYHTSLYVIGPGCKESQLFKRYLGQTPFRAFKDSFFFRYYQDLQALYNVAVEHSDRRMGFGLFERGK